jgi:hypothetical protein
MAELIVEWKSSDPDLARLLASVEAMRGVERLAAEAALHTFQAQHCQQQIGEIEAQRADGRRRSARVRAARAAKAGNTTEPEVTP